MVQRILVIDDEASIRKLFVESLKGSGYQVDTAASGEEGIAMLKASAYNLVFLDLVMPGLDGIDTLKELRKIDKNVRVHIVSGFQEKYLKQLNELRHKGVEFEIFRKPIGKNDIVAITKGEPEELTGGDLSGLRLKLYLVGGTEKSEEAVASFRAFLEAHHTDSFTLEVIDVIENPERADRDNVIATPTLIKYSPPPPMRIIGDYTNGEVVLEKLGLLGKSN